MKARITGTGFYVPPTVVTNDSLAAYLPTSSAWIERHLGLRERRVVKELDTADLACAATGYALDAAGLMATDIDLLIVATTTPARIAPATASLVAERLGAGRAVAFDIAAVCSGFMYALSLARHMIEAGTQRRALVIGSDTFSRITDWQDRDCVYFGDGAGAVVVEQGPGPGTIADLHLFAYADGGKGFTVLPGAATYTMNGPAIKAHALSVLPGAISDLVAAHGLDMADISWLVPHQAGIGVLRGVAEKIGYPFERVLTSMGEYGNTAAASIPLTLALAVQAGKLEPGQRIVLVSVGAGWTWAVGLVEW